jgi:NAD(P)H-hydrate epimerase
MGAFDYGAFAAVCEGKSVVAIGPGLSTHTETQQFVRAAIRDCPLPLILDADGLNAFAGRASDLRERRAPFLAITPHPGEMARLLGRATADVQARRLETAQEVAAQCNAVVILKGQGTIVASPSGDTFIHDSGNPGMATGGTGDVLTGMLAGLTAQFGTQDWARLLGLGVFLHGRAGDFAAARLGQHSLLASDLVDHIPQVFQRSFPPERL